MAYIHLSAILGLLLFVLCFSAFKAPNASKDTIKRSVLLLFGAAMIIRLFAAGLSGGFDNDTACFAAWADRIFQVGPGQFYSADFFTDYPPGYMYLLYPVGALRSLLHISYYSTAHLLLLRLPAILCDLGCGFLLFRTARRYMGGRNSSFLCAAYLFNPAVILNSSVWGQVDSVYTLLLLVMCLSLTKKRTLPAFLSFCAGILIKPQMLVYAPVLFVGICDSVFSDGFSLKKLFQNISYGLLSLLAVLLLVLPFGIGNVLSQYLNTLGSYPYAAVNACNFWGFLGLNWISQDNRFLGLPFHFYGWAAIVVTVLVVLFISFRLKKDNTKYPLLAALLMTSVYLFSVRMHERYLYPAIVLLLLAVVCLPSKRLYLCYSGFSILHFYNTAYVLFQYDPSNYDRKAPLLLIVSAGMLIMGAFLYRTVYLYCFHSDSKSLSSDSLYLKSVKNLFSYSRAPESSQKPERVTKTDLLIMLVITIVYSCFALYDLGDMKAPTSTYSMVQGDTIELDFGSVLPSDTIKMSYYITPEHKRSFTLEGKNYGDSLWTEKGDVTLNQVFTWQDVEISSDTPLLRLSLRSSSASIIELIFTDTDGNILTPVNADDYPALFDEQSLFPDRYSFRNSMYFDEIYHGRTAYEFLHGLTAYENTHPPLGKIIISLGVLLFGMNPFGWRIMGTLFGIAMVPLLYLFSKKITGHSSLAFLAAVLFAFDFMHFTQTRIATIDVYITFFVLFMYLFMYLYSTLSFYDTPLWRTFIPLGLCGISMGLGIACKWTGVYAGVGLAVIFFSVLLRRYQEYRYAVQNPRSATNGISHRHILNVFRPHVLHTILFCVVFFVLLPILIYLLSYLPFRDGSGDGFLLRVLHNQEYMFGYHSALEASHPYSSCWYEWPIMKRPIWYYSSIVTGSSGYGGIREGISAFGNPLVWWVGIPASLYMFLLCIRKKDRTAAFLLTGYMAQYLPWFFVTRITFIYHYFPSVAFVVLMITYSLKQWYNRLSKRRFTILLIIYGAAVFGLFLLFYPVLSGQPVEASFVNRFLRWFDSWVLAAK